MSWPLKKLDRTGEIKRTGIVRHKTTRPEGSGLPFWCIVAIIPGGDVSMSIIYEQGVELLLTKDIEIRREKHEICKERERGSQRYLDPKEDSTNDADQQR